ncbi:MAG: hypothetical protein PHE06_02430 [Lachnospiraceae bacterium]|nr:hypothetical protein [Lachnospiraceae bacterium]
MSRYKRITFAVLLFSLFSFLLFFPEKALECAQKGLLLWYRNLVPVLFPFMVLSNLMIRMDLIRSLLRFLHPFFHFVWGTSLYGSYGILGGFLFGFPMGAKITADLQKENRISDCEAKYLMGFVNNLSPAFVITFVVHSSLQQTSLLFPTLVILYGSPILCSLIYGLRYRKRLAESKVHPQQNKTSLVQNQFELLDACIFDGITNITKLGAYIMLFSLLAGVLDLLPTKNTLLHCIMTGCLEVSAGVHAIAHMPFPFPVQYLCLIAVCSFGGLCALFQTLSIYKMKRDILRHYLISKMVTLGISFLLTLIFLTA